MAHRIAVEGCGGRATGRSGTPTDGCIGEGVVPVSGLGGVVRGAGTSGAALMCRVATGIQGVVGASGAHGYLAEGSAGSSEGLAGGSEQPGSTASRTEVPVLSAGQSSEQSSVPAAGAHGVRDGLSGLDAFFSPSWKRTLRASGALWFSARHRSFWAPMVVASVCGIWPFLAKAVYCEMN